MFRKHWQSGLAIEWFLAGLILLSIGHTLMFLFENMYLPPPYFYEPTDTFADWFNTAYWARHPDGAFDTWTTLYPPLSFVLLRLLSFDSCYPRIRAFDYSPGLAVRDCDWLGLLSIFAFWLLAVVIFYSAMRKIDRARAIPRTICFGLGWSMLDGVERGNLILMAIPFFLLATFPIFKSAKLRWLCAGFAINLKIYLIAPFLAQLILRRWRWVEGVLIAVIAVYGISYAIFGAGTPAQIIRNVTAWNDLEIVNPLDFWFATTYQYLGALMSERNLIFPTLYVLGSQTIELIPILIAVVLRITQVALLAAMIAAWLRPEAVTRYRIYFLGLLFALITSEGGGYTPALWTALLMTEKWEKVGPRFAIICTYLMGLSYDVTLSRIATIENESYIFDRNIFVDANLTLVPLIKPLVIQLIAIAMAATTVKTIWDDIRQQGWAGRYRYRNDAPLLPGVARPERSIP